MVLRYSESKCSDYFFLDPDFTIRTVSMEMVISCVFLFLKAGKFKTSMARVPYNKLLTNIASSSCTGEYWSLVVFALTLLCSVCTAITLGQYSPITERLLEACL